MGEPVKCGTGASLATGRFGAAIVFTAGMAALAYAFVVGGNNSSLASWLYATSLMVIFACMMAGGNAAALRRITQLVFAVLFMISFSGILIDATGTLAISETMVRAAEVPFSSLLVPLMIVPYALTRTIAAPVQALGGWASVLGVLLVVVMAALTIGKGWCAWVCPYGGWEDGFSRVAKKSRLSTRSWRGKIRLFQISFFLLALFLTSGIFESAYYRFLCAFPVGLNAPVVADLSAPVIAAYGVTIALFLGFVVVMPILTRKRFQCATICPMGALMSLAGGLSSFKIRVDFSRCDGCLSCVDACPFYAIDGEAARARKPVPGRECAKCGECVRACPKGAIRAGFAFDKPEALPGTEEACAPGCNARAASSHFLDPERIFEFTAFLLGMFFSSRFGPDGLTRAYSLITGWF